MCGSMADIQFPTAEIRRGKKERRRRKKNPQDENIMVCLIPWGDHKNSKNSKYFFSCIASEILSEGDECISKCLCACTWVFMDVVRYHERMSLTPVDLTVMSTTHLPFAVRQCVYDVNNATSHSAVSRALSRLRWYLVVTTPISAVVQHLSNVPWRPAIARYFGFLSSLFYSITHPDSF